MLARSDKVDELIDSLQNNPAVTLITPEDLRYEDARLVYNRMHDCYPQLIIRTLDVDALKTILEFAFIHHIVLAIRGGGHHIGGFGTCDNGIVLDFSTFKRVHIDAENQTVAVDPGVTLGELDEALAAHRYVVPTGTVSQTGLAGLTLGGGIGWLVGKYALTCDQLCGADVLLADGRLVKAEDPAHRDLLWALRGGGGNFGIVTQFRFTLHPLPKTVCGMGFVPWEKVKDVMPVLLDYMQQDCPAAMTVAPVFCKDKLDKPHLRIDFCCADGTDEDVAALQRVSMHIKWSQIKEWEYAAWQKEFDQAFLPPMRGYWKASYSESLSALQIEQLCEAFIDSPSSRCSILIEHLHGAFNHYGQATSAFPLRHCQFGILLTARWEAAADDQLNIQWVRESFNRIDPLERSDTYSNYTHDGDLRGVNALLTKSLSKIARVKAHYDPNNFFKRNHNVLPMNSVRSN